MIASLRDEPETPRLPPANVEAEQALLGAIFRNNLAYGRVSDFLLPEHFSYAVHQRIYAAIAKLIERGQPADPISLKNLFDQDAALADLGGAEYLIQLAESAVTIINAEDYGRRIHDLHLRRQLIDLGEDVVNEAYSHDLDDEAVNQIERAEARLFQLVDLGQMGRGLQPVAEHGRRALDRIEAAHRHDRRVIGVATGLMDLDRKIGGLKPGNLVILAARPSMGKTALATNIAVNAAKAGARTAFFSIEMPGADLTTRLIAQEAGLSADALFHGGLDVDAFDVIVQGEATLSKLPLEIDDTSGLTIGALRSRARRMKRRGGLGLIVIDYLQLMASQDRRRDGNRTQEVSEISCGLKAVAKDLDVPVLALSQLSRAVEQREDKRPHLADLRESGSIEQDADVVMFLFREEYYLSRKDPHDLTPAEIDLLKETRSIAEVIVAKNRNGPIGTAKLHFHAEGIAFGNLTRTDVR
jgi:replicative DNA helicase